MSRLLATLVMASAMLVGHPSMTQAQVGGPLLGRGVCEIGVVQHLVDRDFETSSRAIPDAKQENPAAAGRYGLTSNATISLELSADPVHFGVDTEAVFYSVGGGLQTSVWSHEKLRVTTSIHYTETFSRTRSEGTPKYVEWKTEWALLAEYPLQVRTVQAVAWAGPALSFLEVRDHDPPNSSSWTAADALGALIGANVVLFGHAVVQANSLWVGSLQWDFFVAYRF